MTTTEDLTRIATEFHKAASKATGGDPMAQAILAETIAVMSEFIAEIDRMEKSA